MHSGFYLLFWGLLFQYNYYFRGFDILPDFLGYILIYKGLMILASENKYFALASKITLPLIVLSLVNFYNFLYHPDLLLTLSYTLDSVKVVVFALNMYLIYNLCRGAIEIAEDIDDYLENTIRQRLYVYLGIAGVFLILSIASLLPFVGVGGSMQLVFILTYISYLFALLIVVSAMFKMYKELKPKTAKELEKSISSNRKR